MLRRDRDQEASRHRDGAAAAVAVPAPQLVRPAGERLVPANPGESRRISANLGESRRISPNLGESRLISRVELVARDGDDERVDERAHERLTATCSRTSSRAARAGLDEGKGVAPRRSEASPMITSVLLDELLLLEGGRSEAWKSCYSVL